MKHNKLSDLPGDHMAHVAVPAIASGTSDEVVVFRNSLGKAIEITGAFYAPQDSVTGDNTNNMAIQMINKGNDGLGSTPVTDLKTFVLGSDIAEFASDAQQIVALESDRRVENGEVLSLNKTENGSGLDLPAGQLTILFEFLN